MKTRKEKKKKSFLYYLNPKNVSAAIAKYGYTYSIKNTILMYVLVIVMSILAGIIFRLGFMEILIISIYGMLMMPKVVINSYRNMYEQKRFSDVNLYIEQVLYSFKKKPMILDALMDVEQIMTNDSPMKATIQNAIDHMLHGFSGTDIFNSGLKIIEKKYDCQRLRDAHALMLKTTKIGGDYHSSIRILLAGRAVWETDTCKFQKECKNRQRMVNIALLLICGVCLFTPLLIANTEPKMDITSSPVYKIGTMLMILMSIRTFVKTDRMTSVNWLKNETALTDDKQLALYRKVKNYDYSLAKKKSLLWALLPVGFGILFLLNGWKYPAIACIPFIFVMLFQHKIDYALAKRRCTEEITKAFPQWLMEITLWLQIYSNVNRAILESIKDAPAILREPLEELVEAFMARPESNEPYMNFLKEFKIAEIQSAMGMLYSISSGRGGNVKLQIDEILTKNTALLNQGEEMANNNRLASLYGQFLFPSILGAAKLLLDMMLIVINFFTMDFY